MISGWDPPIGGRSMKLGLRAVVGEEEERKMRTAWRAPEVEPPQQTVK